MDTICFTESDHRAINERFVLNKLTCIETLFDGKPNLVIIMFD